MKKMIRTVSLLLALIMAVLTLASCSSSLNYEEDDISEYLTLSDADLRNIALSLAKRGTSEDYINDLLFANRKYEKLDKTENASLVIKKGDFVDLYYYMTVDGKDYTGALDGVSGTDSSGNTVYQPGSNVAQTTPTQVYLGDGSLCQPFEDILTNGSYTLGDFASTKKETKTEGTVAAGDIVYITATETYKANNWTTKTNDSYSYKRVKVEAGGEYAFLIGKEIGKTFEHKQNKEVDNDGTKVTKEVTYSGTVDFVSVETAESYTEIEVTFPNDYMIPDLKGKTAKFYVILDGFYKAGGNDYAAKKGDVVFTYYRGVILAVKDAEKYGAYVGSSFDSNYGTSIYSVNIGSGNSVEEFENGFIGKTPSGSLTNAVTEGKIKDVLFDSEGNLRDLKISIMVDAKYSDGQKVVQYVAPYEYLVNTKGESGGEFTVNGDNAHTGYFNDLVGELIRDKLLNYFKNGDEDGLPEMRQTFKKDFTVNVEGVDRQMAVEGYIRFAAEEVNDYSDVGDQKGYIDVVFPDDYGGTSAPHLSGATARFYLVSQYAVPCTVPTLEGEGVDDLIKNTLKYESDKTGDELVADFKSYIESYVAQTNKSYDLNEAMSQIWSHLYAMAQVIEYPDDNVEEEMDKVYEEIKATYNSYKSYYGTSFTQQYKSLADYIKASATESGMQDFEGAETDDYLEFIAQGRIKEKMILYSAAKTLQIIPDEAKYAELKKSFVDEMAAYYGTTAEEIAASYDDADIRMQIISNLLIEKLYEINLGNITRTEA